MSIFLFQAKDLIARLHLDELSSVMRVEPFYGTFPKLGTPIAISGKVHQNFHANVYEKQLLWFYLYYEIKNNYSIFLENKLPLCINQYLPDYT